MALKRFVAVAVAAIFALGAGTAQAAPLAARASFRPATVLFGDPVRAIVTVTLDSSAVDAGGVHVEPSFTPYSPTGPPTVKRTESGPSETLEYSYRLMCVDDGCLPGKKPLVLRFPPVVVTAKGLMVRAALPALTVSSRLGPGATASASPRFRAPETVPPVQYSVSPGLLSWLLVAAATMLGVAALLVLGLGGVRLAAQRRRRALLRRTPLEVALAYVRQAAPRPASDRRKALGLLAGTLDARGDDALAAEANEAAWEEQPPGSERALALADEVEAAMHEGSA